MNYKTPPWLAFLIGILIFVIARFAGGLPETISGESITETLPWLGHAITKTVLIVIALIGSYIVTRGALGGHGYRRGKRP